MIIIGSEALRIIAPQISHNVADLDLIGTKNDIPRIRRAFAESITEEKTLHNHRHTFFLKNQAPYTKIELDYEQSISDQLLSNLCSSKTQLNGLEFELPSLNALFLIKRAHCNVPVTYDKTISDLIKIKPFTHNFSEKEIDFYKARKEECNQRYQTQRQRFKLSISNEEFFKHGYARQYDHDDLHRAIAFTPGRPIFELTKKNIGEAKIDIPMFQSLPFSDQLKMVQEEFMVIGIERFYLHNTSIDCKTAYAQGLHKTVRDLFTGFFQDFCIDNIEKLSKVPDHDFIQRFNDALINGRVRILEHQLPEIDIEHKKIAQLVKDKDFNIARALAEDKLRKSNTSGDPHTCYLMAKILMQENKLDLAEKFFKFCITGDKKNRWAWFYLGALNQQAGKLNLALKCFTNAKALGLDSHNLYHRMGACYESLGFHERAAESFNQAKLIKSKS